MNKISYKEFISIVSSLNDVNEVICIDKGGYYCLNYKNIECDVGKTPDNSHEFEVNYLDKVNKPQRYFPPFKSKNLPDGTKLFRRKHGKIETIQGNSEKLVIFECPYAKAKINKIEVIDANPLDQIDLYVNSPKDAAIAALYGMPADYMLNQFGFGVAVSGLLYSDKSDYDADVYQGFQVIVKYKNRTSNDKEVGFNLIFHEVQ